MADAEAKNISAIDLHVRSKPFRGRRILDPREVEVRQYLEDESTGLETQAQAVVAAAPESPVAWARLAQTLSYLGKAEEAIHAATTAITWTAKPSRAADGSHIANTARHIAARVLAAFGEDGSAEEALESLPHGGPWTVLYAALAEKNGKYHQALERLGDDGSLSALSFRGYLFLQLNQGEAGLRQLRAARRVGDASPSLMLNLAFAYALIGSSSKAVRAAKQAVVLSPTDRQASFNLASYLRAAGRMDEALAELRRLQSVRDNADPQIAAAIADIYAVRDDPRLALRELRRAWHHNSLGDRSTALAELAANIALLEWRLGERTRDSAADVIRAQLKKVGTHPQLAFMLADISRTSAAAELERLYSSLQTELPERDLVPLRIQILMHEGELEDAARNAMSHMESHPLGMAIASGSIVLYGQVFGDYESAGDAGKKALRRMPGDRILINNIAFCLTLAGHAREAESLFARQEISGPYLLATRGLIDLGLGKIRDGLARYDEAAKFARAKNFGSQNATDFVKLLRAQEVIAIHQLHLAGHPDIPTDLSVVRAPRDWREYTEYLVLDRVAKRLNVPWIIENSELSAIGITGQHELRAVTARLARRSM